jgi:hypothetical protein
MVEGENIFPAHVGSAPARGGQQKSRARMGRGWGEDATNGYEFIGQKRLDRAVSSGAGYRIRDV